MLVTQLWSTLFDPTDYSLLGSSVHGIFQARILECVAIPFSRGFSDPGVKAGSSKLQADSLPSKQPGKPKNTGVGSLALLQGIVPTQESNPGVPHYRQLLYHLSYVGSPMLLLSRGQNCLFFLTYKEKIGP